MNVGPVDVKIRLDKSFHKGHLPTFGSSYLSDTASLTRYGSTSSSLEEDGVGGSFGGVVLSMGTRDESSSSNASTEAEHFTTTELKERRLMALCACKVPHPNVCDTRPKQCMIR